MYGLPKVNKRNVPLRPILSMLTSTQYKLAKWLVKFLHPVLQHYSEYCIPESFQFKSDMHKLQCTFDTELLVSFDICSLFTNVPLDETIGIFADYLHRCLLKPPFFPESVIDELMQIVKNLTLSALIMIV